MRDGHEPALPDAERLRRGDDLHAAEVVALELPALVHEHDAGPVDRGGERRLATRLAAADHEHAGAPVLGVGAVLAAAVLVHLAEAGGVAQELLDERPEGARPVPDAVVEADRRERAADLVRHRHQVEVERAANVLRDDDRALADGHGARAHVGDTVHGHHAVRAVARAAEQAARPVVLEAAREDPLPRGVERRAERVTRESADALSLKEEGDFVAAVDPLAGRRGSSLMRAASTFRTSFVRVSRSARNQAPQPWRCVHHSRWTPATLRRKYT